MEQKIKRELKIFTKELKEITSLYHYASKKNGISDSEFCILYSIILLEEECTQSDICNLWSFPRQTVNSSIAILIKKDYITLEKEETGNKKNIKFTESGREYGEKIVREVMEAEQKALLSMSKEERKECIRLVRKYTKSLKENIY